jgi:hypothetical protein
MNSPYIARRNNSTRKTWWSKYALLLYFAILTAASSLSFAVMPMRLHLIFFERRPARAMFGKGCVGYASSPTISDAGTDRSSTGILVAGFAV